MQTRAAAKQSPSHASRPFVDSRAERASAFFSPATPIRTKLTTGAPGDPFEREADRVADRVVQRMAAGPVSAAGVPSVQAACAACGGGRQDTVCQHGEPRQAEAEASSDAGTHVPESLQRGLTEQRSAGQPLDSSLRQEMEQHIGADFSGVRIHTGAPAAALDDMVQAHAFTHGQDVFFNSGQFEPQSSVGRHLLAHELTHVVQQSRGAPNIQRDDVGGGSTEFTDSVTSTVRSSASPVISGTVTRTETAPAIGESLPQVIHSGTMNIEFDPTTCRVTIPFGYRFVQALPANAGPCDVGAHHTLLSPTAFAALKANVPHVVNAGLNGWFDVQLSGRGCPSSCADRPLPIRVVAREDDAHPDKTITVVNRSGRSDAGTICALSWNDTTAVHEGGHQVLGVGDEYPEHDEEFRADAPHWFRTERVRRDYSMMGPEAHTRFAMFQARHFAAVTAFLQRIYPNCTATLMERARPVIPDFRVGLTGGYAAVSGLPAYFVRLGFDVGIPLDRMRRWELTLGPEFTLLVASGDRRSQTAFLLGARLGLEGGTGDAGFGVTGGPFISAGYGWFNSRDPSATERDRDAGMAYGEVGARFGIRTGLDVFRFNLGLEGAAGSTLGAPGVIGPTGPDIASDPSHTYWFRFGLGAAVQF